MSMSKPSPRSGNMRDSTSAEGRRLRSTTGASVGMVLTVKFCCSSLLITSILLKIIFNSARLNLSRLRSELPGQ